MSKNPFEIRLELLQLSKDMLDRQYDLTKEAAHSAFEIACKMNNEVLDEWEKYTPKMYTFDDIIETAKQMQAFVDNNK